ncbi:MAG: DEAD/DEAH box helicase family protein, partial [Planctomycetota bacterium]
MILARRILPSLLALLVVLAACGKDEPKSQLAQRKETPDDLGKLVPADAIGFFRFAPLDQLQPKIRELVGYFDEQQAQKFDVAELFEMAGIPAARIDRSKPAGIAVVLVGEQKRPMPTFILPLTEPDKPIEGRTLPRSGSYVAVAMGGAPAAGTTTPALARDLPEGDVAVRWDARKLVGALRPMIEPYLSAEAITKMSPELAAQPRQNIAMLDAMADWVRKLMDSADSMEGVLSFSGGKLDMAFELTVLEGSPMDKPGVEGGIPLSELSKRVDAEGYPMVLLARGDMAELVETLMPMYEAMMADASEEQRARFLAYMEESKKVYDLMGPSFAMAADFGAGGLEMVGAMAPEDPAS